MRLIQFVLCLCTFIVSINAQSACMTRSQAEVQCSSPTFFVNREYSRCAEVSRTSFNLVQQIYPNYAAIGFGSLAYTPPIYSPAFSQNYGISCSQTMWSNRGNEIYENCVIQRMGICEIQIPTTRPGAK